MAIVAEGTRGRVYLSPLEEHTQVAKLAKPKDYPDTDLPKQALSMRVMLYGMDKHYKLFTPRQLVALTTFSDLVQEARERVLADAAAAFASRSGTRKSSALSAKVPKQESGILTNSATGDDRPLAEGGMGAVAYADAVATYLGIAASKSADGNSVICSWMPGIKYEVVRTTFSRQALPMTWDHAESNPFAGSSGDYLEQVNRTSNVLDIGVPQSGTALERVAQLDACHVSRDPTAMFSTDPPYYDNIGYADLSDFFYIWLRRSLVKVYPSLFATLLTPKSQELIASPYRHDGNKEKAQVFFEDGLGQAFTRMQQVQNTDIPLTVFYAFKQAETDDDEDESSNGATATFSTGWETMLAGLINAGFSIHGTWPMRTERSVRSVGLGTNALASSIVLVCRPRLGDAPFATRKQFITALRQELPDALRNLQHGNIAPVDLAQAAIGPGMAVFTRYAKVMETDGNAMTVRTALGLINQALDEVLAEQEGEFDGDTRWALAWFEQFGMDDGPFGVAETLSKAKNTAVNGLVEAGVVTARGGKVRLVKRAELTDDWNPTHDGRLTVWQTTQHLIRTLVQHGESGAAALLHKLGGLADSARDLSYRLYTLCERKKWADEALAYNGLVIAWPELTKLARAERTKSPAAQPKLF
jgi:putative DNA methylase